MTSSAESSFSWALQFSGQLPRNEFLDLSPRAVRTLIGTSLALILVLLVGVGGASGASPVYRIDTSGEPVTNFKRSNLLYRTAMRYNRGLDRDKDGIACEKL